MKLLVKFLALLLFLGKKLSWYGKGLVVSGFLGNMFPDRIISSEIAMFVLRAGVLAIAVAFVLVLIPRIVLMCSKKTLNTMIKEGYVTIINEKDKI